MQNHVAHEVSYRPYQACQPDTTRWVLLLAAIAAVAMTLALSSALVVHRIHDGTAAAGPVPASASPAVAASPATAD